MIKRIIIVTICYYLAFTFGAATNFLPFYYGGGFDPNFYGTAYCSMLIVIFFTVIHSLPPIKDKNNDSQEDKK